MPTPIKPDDLWNHWSRKQWKAHYLFAGQEDFLIEQACDQALHHWLGPEPDSLHVDRLDTETHSVEQILEAAKTVPYFGGERVLCIQNASQWTVKEQDRVAEGLESLDSETHCLFIWGREWRREDAQKSLVEALFQKGDV